MVLVKLRLAPMTWKANDVGSDGASGLRCPTLRLKPCVGQHLGKVAFTALSFGTAIDWHLDGELRSTNAAFNGLWPVVF